MDSAQVVDRMMKSAKSARDEATQRGKDAGRLWAQECATPADLRTIAARSGADFSGEGPDQYTRMGWLLAQIDDYRSSDGPDEFNEYAKDRFGELTEDGPWMDSYIGGFIMAALEVWDEIEDKIGEA